MRLKEFKQFFFQGLEESYPKTEFTTFFRLLAEAYLGLDRLQVALNPDLKLNESQLKKMEMALARLKKHEPIQYVLGETEFFGRRFKVNPTVLIPRPETEELIGWIIEEETLKNKAEGLKILDIGTGSGCISITLAKEFPKAELTAIDISAEALAVARQNAHINKANVNLAQQNILRTNQLLESYDIVVSNPPYVRELEKKEMYKNVLDHEPTLALYVEDQDPLLFYRKIAQLARQNFTKKGVLYFEINQYFPDAMKRLLKNQGFENVELKKDIFGNTRFCRASL